jgi:hypothetical protein
MKIYFTAAISAMDKYAENYRKIVSLLEKAGHQIKSDHILGANIGDILGEDDEKKIEYYKNFLKWLNSADAVIAEASFPSTVHIGHEISLALEKGKPVVVLYTKSKMPVFLQGVKSDKLFLLEYSLDDLGQVIDDALEDARDQMDVRFNFFVSPKIVGFLDWVAKKKKMPRAVYLRRLIEQDMEKNKDFSEE